MATTYIPGPLVTDNEFATSMGFATNKICEFYTRLLAAAPELYAALSRVREAWGDQIRDDTEIDAADLVDWLVSWYNLEVMPALRKAEGEG